MSAIGGTSDILSISIKKEADPELARQIKRENIVVGNEDDAHATAGRESNENSQHDSVDTFATTLQNR